MIDYQARLERARRELDARNVDVLLASLGSDLPYLTGYTAMPLERLTMAVIPRHGEVVLVVPELEAPRVAAQSGAFAVRPWGETDDPIAMVADLMGAARRAMIGEQTWSVFLLGLQERCPNTTFLSARPVTEALRVTKEPAEVDLLRQAGAVADRVAGLLSERQFSGKTELQVARAVGVLLEANGADRAAFAIVAAGPNGASPHHEPGDRVIAAGDAVVVDFGGTVGGYHSDTTRMYHVGEPSARYREVHDVVLAAQQAGVDAVRPGVPAEEVDAAARAVIAAAGFAPYFIHRTGHGIGLDTHEDPYLVEGNTRLLAPGMAFSIEPGIYLPDEFGVRIEDIVVCTEDGAERLNNSPRTAAIVE
jgi:Xaa-Pro aminopeptidase